MNLLNVGCGGHFHKDWINIDMTSNSPYVKQHDIRKGLPFEDNSIDGVYSSHVLEHLKEHEADNFFRESYRVLKRGGIFRVVIPDLERIAISYLETLNNVRNDFSEKNEANYDWMMLELYDQTIRDTQGGKMGIFLSQKSICNKEFIMDRIGFETQSYWDSNGMKKSKFSNIKQWVKRNMIRMSIPPFTETHFRRKSGEIHRWMYDSFSLMRLMKQYGFDDISISSFDNSRIMNFSEYNLESVDGKERKPDSLYMEGIK